MVAKWTNSAVEAMRNAADRLAMGDRRRIDVDSSHSRGHLTRILNREIKQVDVETLFAFLSHEHVDELQVLTDIGLDLRFNPFAYLQRITGQDSQDTLLDLLERSLDELENRGPDEPTVDQAAVFAKLKVVDEARYARLRPDLDTLLADAVGACVRSGSRSLIVRGLATYAERRRHEARFGLAARALRKALQAVDKPCRAGADALQSTSYLFSNHGWLKMAELCAEQACSICVRLHDLEGIGKMMVTKAIMVSRQDRLEEAIALYRDCLQYFPEESSQWIYRFAILQSMARCQTAIGELGEAEQSLHQAVLAHRSRHGLNWYKVHWDRGELALHRGFFGEAETCFRITIAGLEREGANAIEIALSSLLLTKALLLNGKMAEVHKVADGMCRLLEPLRANQVACGVILRFVNMSWAGRVTVKAIDTALNELEASARPGTFS